MLYNNVLSRKQENCITFIDYYFSMNTLFRVLYTVAIQWRTYMMVCGPDGGWGCFSLINREMVRNPDKCRHRK